MSAEGLNAAGLAHLAAQRADAAAAAAAFAEALALDPGRPDIRFNLANALVAADRPAEAETEYRALLAEYPDHVGVLTNLGNALHSMGRHAEALDLYRRVIALRPGVAGALNNVGNALIALNRPAEAEPVLRQAVAADPAYAQASNNLGGALLALDRPAEALEWFRRAMKLEPDPFHAQFGAAMAQLTLGDYRQGWRDYEARWRDPRFTIDVPDYTTPTWDGGGIITGQRMLLHCEQGLGDSIQFVRYVPLVRQRGAHVVLQIQAPLAGLVAHLADTVVPQPGNARDQAVPPHDLRCPLMSLPRAFGTRVATIPAGAPYLAADPARITEWRARLGPATKRRIGVAFSGSPEHPDDAQRSIPAARLLAALPNAELHVLQRDIRPADAASLDDARVHSADLADFRDTAALLACMDLVVSVDTSIAHLAGAMGRPVWILIQFAADFRWLRLRTDSPWYPSARLFRQPRAGDWDTPLAAVAAALTTIRHPP